MYLARILMSTEECEDCIPRIVKVDVGKNSFGKKERDPDHAPDHKMYGLKYIYAKR